MRQRSLFVAVLGLLASPLLADVKTYKNDSLPLKGGGTIACQAGFIANEIGAAVFTVQPGDGRVMVVETQFWACDGSGFGFAQARPMQVLVYPNGGPNPEPADYTSPTLTANPNFLNLWPTQDQDLVYDEGSQFTVGVKLLQGSLFQNFTTLATDADGCQPGKSLIFAIPGGWTDACALGVSGDMFVRARVLTNGPVNYGAGLAGSGGQVPTIDSSGPWWIGNSQFAITGTNVAPSSPGLLGYSFGTASLPFFGGTLLLDISTASFLGAASDVQGNVSTNVPLPLSAGLVGVHVYFQQGFIDPGAPQSVSLSDGLDVEISSQ